MRRRTLWAAGVAALAAWGAGPRAPAGGADAGRVVIRVTVKDASGNLVEDIRQEEFRVLEDGVEQGVAAFSQEAAPLAAVILFDNGLPSKTANEVERSTGAIAGGFSEFDEASLLQFAEFPSPAEEFTSDNDTLHSRLKRVQLTGQFPGRGSGPMTAGPRINSVPVGPGVAGPGREERRTKNIDDAVYAAANLLKGRSASRRRIILLVSDGANSRNNTFRFETARKLLLTERIAVYAIGVGEAARNRSSGALARYAQATGGDVYYAGSRAELEGFYARITEQARNAYTLEYSPRGTDRTKEYHEIEVRVRRGSLNVLAQEGYFAAAGA